jgi:hypothetical protein
MKLYNDPERGIVFNPNWPVEPEYCTDVDDLEFRKFNSQVELYNSALQTAIGEAIPFENQNAVKTIVYSQEYFSGKTALHITEAWIKPNTFYEVPDLKLKLLDFGNGYFAKQLYRIVSEPKQEPKVETQEELGVLIILQRYEAGMSEYFRMHDYRNMYSLWEKLLTEIKNGVKIR